MREQDEVLTQILQAADKHPNSRVSKLIRGVVEEPSQKNIVLLLVELSEHSEFSTDFGISLKYYLDLYDRLGVGLDIVLNEAGLLLLNSSKIYARRVDYVQELVERQILTLSAADKEIENSNNDAQQAAPTAEKPKRGRKRLVEAPNDPYEVELVPKKIRKLSAEKRFAIVAGTKTKPKATSHRQSEIEQYIHPAGWQHSHIVDLDNEEEIDSKRNYKLFTYHVEHRYNTLVPDINFRLHFKVKDYIDEEEERMQNADDEGSGESELQAQRRLEWPPLSEAYVNKYLNLENHILAQEQLQQSQRTDFEALNDNLTLEHFGDADDVAVMPKSAVNNAAMQNVNNENQQISENPALEQVQNLNLSNVVATATECNNDASLDANLLNSTANESTQNDSGLGNSLLDASKSSSCNDGVNTSISLCCEADKSISDAAATTAATTSETAPSEEVQNLASSTANTSTLECSADLSTTADNLNTTSANDQTMLQNDSALGHSLASTVDESMRSNECNTSASILEQSQTEDVAIRLDTSGQMQRMDSGFDSGLSDVENSPTKEKSIDLPESQRNSNEPDHTQINLGEIRVHLPHLEDAAYFSDLDEQDKRMLSPTVLANDILPGIPNKMNITIIVEDQLKDLMSVFNELPETYMMAIERQLAITPIIIDMLKIPLTCFKRPKLFKIKRKWIDARRPYWEERDRALKRTSTAKPRVYRPMKLMKLSSKQDNSKTCASNVNDWYESDSDESGAENDFLGFTAEEQELLRPQASNDVDDEVQNHRLSRDSGVGADMSALPTKSNLDTIKEEDSGVESAGNSESLENCIENDCGVSNTTEIEVPTSESAGNEIVSAEISEFLDKLLEEAAAATPVNSDETNEAVTAETNLTSADAPKETSTNTEIKQAGCAIDKNEDKPTETNLDLNGACNRKSDILSMDDEGWNNDEVHVRNNKLELELDETLDFSKSKIQKWHEHLLPILAKSRERHHFDVFEIGTEIIDKLQTDDDDEEEENNEQRRQSKCISFQNVMEDKDESYVSRYFLSSLLLANQNNIQFTVHNKSSEEPSAWSDLQFELLSTQRHTVAIEDNIGMINTNTKSDMPAAKKPRKSKTKTSSHNTSTIGDDDEPCSTINMTSSSAVDSAKVTPSSGRENISTTAPPAPAPAQHSNNLLLDNDVFNVNLNIVRPLKQIEKMPRNSDDYDSGIFSSEELASLC